MTQYTEIFVETAKLGAIEDIDALILADDGIKIALNIAGYNVAEMNQFERASALLDMATEYASIPTINTREAWEYDKRHIDEKPFDVVFNTRRELT